MQISIRHACIGILFAIGLLQLAGCGDSPLYSTQISNGVVHGSNGHEFGSFTIASNPSDPLTGSVLAPTPIGRWCNKFGWAGDHVAGIVIEYADRAFADPPRSTKYLYLNTATHEVIEFESLDELEKHWTSITSDPFPTMQSHHPTTRTHW